MDQLTKIWKKAFHQLSAEERAEIAEYCSSEVEFEEMKHFFLEVDAVSKMEAPPVEAKTKQRLDALFATTHDRKKVLWYNSVLGGVWNNEKSFSQQTLVRIAAILLVIVSIYPLVTWNASSVSEAPKLTQNETSTEKASENKVESIQSDQPLESTSEKSKLEKKEPVLMASNSQNKSAIRSDVSTTNQLVAFSDVFMEEMDLKMETSTSSAAKPFLVSENAHVLDLLTPCF